MDGFKEQLNLFSIRFNQKISKLFPLAAGAEKRVAEAMSYSVMNGGKRLRPYLVYETAKLFGKDFDDSFAAGASLECLHTYSLIHDDLPAMDNDDLRRGKPTCHKQFDEATAILAGDGLLTYAFEILANAPYEANIKIELIQLLSKGAGAFNGMIAGQMLDLYAETLEKPENPLSIISHIEEMKTGCLLCYACQAGAVIGGADSHSRQALYEFARKIGIAFQITDDILDVEGDQNLVGKTLKKDDAQNKLTFVSCYGLEEARQKADNLIREAKDIVSVFGEGAVNLQALADFILERKY